MSGVSPFLALRLEESMSNDQIRVVAHFDIQPGQRAEFERLVNEAATYADENEPETLIYDWYIADDDSTARVYELYESSDALLAHLGGKIGTEILPPIMGVAPMTSVEIYGKASDQLAAAAQNFPAILFGERLAGVNR